MIIRREDFGDINKLTKGSQKRIWFTCESCGIGILQAYKNYLKQKEGKFCRSCRNKHSGNKEYVKKKHSINSKKMWGNKNYRKKISPILSKAVKKSWNKNDGARRKWLSENNPMNNLKTRETISKLETTPEIDLKNVAESNGFEYIKRIRKKRGGVRLVIKCSNGHITEKRLDTFRNNVTGCSICKIQLTSSNAEKEIFKFIKSIYDNKILLNNRNILKKLELDIVIPEKKIAIEYCGLYWHSEKNGKDRNYHLNKLKLCEEKGYRLITIFEDEWINKQDIVKSRLKYILGLETERIYARNCEIKEIDSKKAKEFIDRYHIQGYQGSKIKLGAFHNEELVAVMTFSKPSLAKGRKDQNNNTYEISRFCSSINVIGIAGKLLKYFQKNYDWKEIYSFADRRWSEGNLYETLGMSFIKNTKPNYWYFKTNQKRFHRFKFRKNVLSENLEVFDPNKTEYENMLINGWNRIWDCGSNLYEIKNH